MTANPDTHSKTIGYLLWIFGFTGAHRFYYGKPITGIIWFCTLGCFLKFFPLSPTRRRFFGEIYRKFLSLTCELSVQKS